jgi:hypothetical protein
MKVRAVDVTGQIEHSLLHDHDVVRKPGLLRPNEIKQLRALNKGSLIFGCNTSQPQAPTVHKRSRIIKAAIDDVLHQEMYEVLFTLLRIFSAFRKFGAPQAPVSWAMVIHPFVRNNFDTP